MTHVIGSFGSCGGINDPEAHMPAAKALSHEYGATRQHLSCPAEVVHLLKSFACTTTQSYHTQCHTDHMDGPTNNLKREDLCQIRTHMGNNTVGQVLPAKRMGTSRLRAQPGAGQHGITTVAEYAGA